jgi:hypothetical protein
MHRNTDLIGMAPQFTRRHDRLLPIASLAPTAAHSPQIHRMGEDLEADLRPAPSLTMPCDLGHAPDGDSSQ